MLVVGAGPAGSSAAWHLAREGAHVTMLDRARFPREKPCAEYLSPEASRILSAMGALEACEAAGAAHLAGMVIRAPSGARIRGEFAAAHGFRAFRDRGLALQTHGARRDLARAGTRGGRGRARGRASYLSTKRFTRRGVWGAGARRCAAIGDATEIRARLVIGADGLRSTIARRIGVARHAIRSASTRLHRALSRCRGDHRLRRDARGARGVRGICGRGPRADERRRGGAARERARERRRESVGVSRIVDRGASTSRAAHGAGAERATRRCA